MFSIYQGYRDLAHSGMDGWPIALEGPGGAVASSPGWSPTRTQEGAFQQ